MRCEFRGLEGGQRLHRVDRGELELIANAHGVITPVNVFLSFCNPERILVLIVPSGTSRRTATSAYVSSEKNAGSMARRSSCVSDPSAARRISPRCLNARRSCGSAALV